MSVNNVQHLAILGLASMAFADLANAASESGNETLNQMFNEGGVGYEASQAVKQVMSQPMDRNSGVQIALHLLRMASHPLADIFDACESGQLKSCLHHHKHGTDAFLVRINDGEDIKAVLNQMDPVRFEIDDHIESLESTPVTLRDLAPLDARFFDEIGDEEEVESIGL